MQYRILGKTGLKVSQVGFGGIPIQHVPEAEAEQLVKRAVALGVNFFDSSRIYGNSEEILGKGLKGIRGKVHIATKSRARDKETMKRDIHASLEKFDTDCIELYQFHNVGTLADLETVMAPGGAIEAFMEARNEGLIKHIGITSHSLDVIEAALKHDVLETVQYPYNAVERQAEAVFKKAAGLNLGIIAMKPIAGGALRNGEGALKFIMENPDVTCAIPGMDSIPQLEANVEAILGGPLPEEEREVLLAEAKELGQAFCRRCGYCQPCPQKLNIPMIFTVEGYYTRYHLEDWAVERYADLPATAGDCVKCGACEPKCPYHLPIREMLDRVKSVMGR